MTELKTDDHSSDRHYRLGCFIHESHPSPLAKGAVFILMVSLFAWVGLIVKWAVDGVAFSWGMPVSWMLWIPIALWPFVFLGLLWGISSLEDRFTKQEVIA